MIMSMHRFPVRGSEHSLTILASPFLELCSIITMTRRTPATRSMAPPMPLTILPGIIQLAMSPSWLICMAPRIASWTCPPRIISKDSLEEKNAAPGTAVMVCLPALMRSASTLSSVGKGPMPSSPFSDWSQTCIPSGMWLATRVGIPIPRFTTKPSRSS